MKPLKFGIILKEDNILEWKYLPYLFEQNNDASVIVHSPCVASTPRLTLEKWQEKLIGLCNYNSYTELNRRYNKKHKKINLSTFYENADATIKQRLLNSIDISNASILELLMDNTPITFLYEPRANVYHLQYKVKYNPRVLKETFRFEKTDNELRYALDVAKDNVKLDLQSKQVYLLSKTTPVILNKNELLSFENRQMEGVKIYPFLKKKVVIVSLKFEAKYFESFISKVVGKFNCAISGFNVENIHIPFTPNLSIEKTFLGEYILKPIFDYKEWIVNFDSDQKSKIEVTLADGKYGLRKIHRKIEEENTYLNFLSEIGLKRESKYFVFPEEINDKYQFITAFNDIAETLNNKGFQIHNKLFSNTINTSKYYIKQKTNFDKDWFNLKITIVVGVFEIQFKEFKEHILQKDKEYILPDGSVFIIPDAWFSELAYFAKRVNDTNISEIQKAHISILASNKIILPDETMKPEMDVFFKDDKVELPKINAVLRDYQKAGYRWLFRLTQLGYGGCLADDMGLGKTLQVITLLQKNYKAQATSSKNITLDKPTVVSAQPGKQLSIFDVQEPLVVTPKTVSKIKISKKETEAFKTSLIIVPKSLLFNWEDELRKFAPHLSYFIYSGNDRNALLRTYVDKRHLMIATYGVVRRDIENLQKIEFDYLILDESQAIKNPNTKNYKAVVKLDACHRVTITGTPIENNLTDLWAQMNFLNPNILGSQSYFEKYYKSPISQDENATELADLRKIIQPFILRRLKKDVAKELPDKIEQVLYCEMDKEQKKWYESEVSSIRNELLKEDKKQSFIDTLSVINKLRQIALHPDLVDATKEFSSGKFEQIILKMNQILEQGDKFLVFSSFVKHLNLFKAYFEKQNIPYSMLTGKDNKRADIVSNYRENDAIKPFLISIKAGGSGLNLTEANYVLIIDPWWNPFVEQQAIDRTHRIGQKQSVNVYRFITKDSIEEKILQLQQSKLKTSADLLSTGLKGKIGKDELLQLVMNS